MSLYSGTFFAHIRGGSRRSAQEIVPLVMTLLQPRSVVDVGCGVGTWLNVFQQHGVEDICGIDGSYVDTQTLEIPVSCFMAHDLTQPLRLARSFDLVMSLEVAEHVPSAYAEDFIASLTRLGPVVLFSAAIPFQGGTHHVNEQWPAYWIARFQRHGYVAVDYLRPLLWHNTHVEWWYTQNMLLFVRQDCLAQYPALHGVQAPGATVPLALVHPRKYLEVVTAMQQMIDTIQDIARLIPLDDTFILVDEDQLRAVVAAGRPALPFLEHDGAYWGPPHDDAPAIDACERLRAAGARFIVFAWPAFWWLEYYAVFRAHLAAHYACVLQSDRLLAFDMRQDAESLWAKRGRRE